MKKLCISMVAIGFISACGGGGDANNKTEKNNTTLKSDFIPSVTFEPNRNIDFGLPPKWYDDFGESFVDAKLPKVGDIQRLTYPVASKTQVFNRAQKLGLTTKTAVDLADKSGENITQIINQKNPEISETIEFKGTRTSELNRQIKSSRRILIKKMLTVDEQVSLSESNVVIKCSDEGGFQGIKDYENSPTWRPPELQNKGIINKVTSAIKATTNNSIISGCTFRDTQAVIAENSTNLKIDDIKVYNSPGYGVIWGFGNKNSLVNKSKFRESYGSGIVVIAKNENLVISDNTVENGIGGSNYHAGILISDRDTVLEVGKTDFLLFNDFHFPVAKPIFERAPARKIYIINNSSRLNLSSGIYLDGAAETYLANNQIFGNSKEGICFDNGTTSSVAYNNSIESNGKRWGKTDLILEKDFVKSFGRMKDGSSKSKVPGISIDNAIYNLIIGNSISRNHGSGIKMVRSSFYNYIGRNNVSSNNKGKNDKFFFFGIEIGGALADAPSVELDFLQSMGNIIYQNIISGSHYAGIQFCQDCEDNEIFDNVITTPEVWSIEQTRLNMKNFFINNFSIVKSRNTPLNALSKDGQTLTTGKIINDPASTIWERDIQAFETEDRANPPPKDSNLFVGSSTIRLWDTKKSFSNQATLNRGFGGSQLIDLNFYLDRVIGVYQPKNVFIYSGENDIEQGKSTDVVLFDFKELVKNIRRVSPSTKIYYISIKPSPARWQLESKFKEANQKIKSYSDSNNVKYIDIHDALLWTDGKPNGDMYKEDKLHLSDKGYTVLNNAITKYVN